MQFKQKAFFDTYFTYILLERFPSEMLAALRDTEAIV